MKLFAFIVIFMALPVVSAAHVAFTPDSASAGGKYVGALRVSHGCKGAATTGLRVEIPDGVGGAKPQAKPGWAISVERTGDKVSAITWTGQLPDDEFDDFTVMLTLPKDAGALYFPAVQTCGPQAVNWRDIPTVGQDWHDVEHPAPVLNVSAPDGTTDGHHH